MVVLDNVIVPNSVLTNLNPEDIESVNILKGANAAALYGSDASNGALIVTTKKGKAGVSTITFANTTSFENISFFPKLQGGFGLGSADGRAVYNPYENQQYGPAYDGSLVEIGKPLADGSIQKITYESRLKEKEKFWDTGLTNQTDFAISSGNEKSTLYFSGQYVDTKGTTPKDKYNRAAIRLNGTRDVTNNVKLGYNASYTQNRSDIQTNGDRDNSVYWNVINTSAMIPITQYKNWQSDPFANPNGYYNEYYDNPYWIIDNNRSSIRNDYFVANTEVKWDLAKWVNLTYRAGVSTRNNSSKSTQDKFTFTDYTSGISASKTNLAGGLTDESLYSTQLNSDFLAQFSKDIKDFSFKATLGNSIRQNQSKNQSISASGLVNPGVFNIANRIGEPIAGEANYKARQIGVFGDFTLGYKNYLFLHATGRNDWNSILSKDNRSFFYPSVDVSFIPTDVIPGLKDNNVVDFIKLRAGYSKVGQVNLTGANDTYGAYSLDPTFSAGGGFPFGSLPGFTLDGRLVSPSLKPEFTSGYEVGTDMNFLRERVRLEATYYSSQTDNQTVSAGVSRSTGYSQYLVNAGTVSNNGFETALHFTPIQSNDWTLNVGGNYTFSDNKVESISSDLNELQLSTGGFAQVYATVGQSFPTLKGTDYLRDPQGNVIVDSKTGYPSQNPTIVSLGNTVAKHRLGLDMEIKYKSIRFAALAEYRGGYVVYNAIGSDLDFTGASERSAAYGRERFVIPNSSIQTSPGVFVPNTNITVQDGGAGFWANSAYNTGIASNYVSPGDFWKIREVSLTYELPKALLASTKYVKAATLGLQGRNLFTFLPKSNQYTDPEYNFSSGNAIGINTINQTPPTRYYGATLSLTF